jgi:hypothetical protein
MIAEMFNIVAFHIPEVRFDNFKEPGRMIQNIIKFKKHKRYSAQAAEEEMSGISLARSHSSFRYTFVDKSRGRAQSVQRVYKIASLH